jgi:hypothetical protein
MRTFCASLALVCSLAASAVFAAPTTTTKTKTPKANVIVGSMSCFIIRECAVGQTPQQRADHITDVFNKYLGGSSAAFAIKPTGKNTVITMNKDQLLVVTPQDAKTAKAKNSTQLAAAWKAQLAKAFNETKAVK